MMHRLYLIIPLILAWIAVGSLAFLFVGCTSSRSETATNTVTIERERGTVEGKKTDIIRETHSEERAQSRGETNANMEAMAAMLGQSVQAAITNAVPGADAIGKAVSAAVAVSIPKPEEKTDWATIAAGVGSTLTAVGGGLLVREERRKRVERQASPRQSGKG
jgi:hypothetical protein